MGADSNSAYRTQMEFNQRLLLLIDPSTRRLPQLSAKAELNVSKLMMQHEDMFFSETLSPKNTISDNSVGSVGSYGRGKSRFFKQLQSKMAKGRKRLRESGTMMLFSPKHRPPVGKNESDVESAKSDGGRSPSGAKKTPSQSKKERPKGHFQSLHHTLTTRSLESASSDVYTQLATDEKIENPNGVSASAGASSSSCVVSGLQSDARVGDRESAARPDKRAMSSAVTKMEPDAGPDKRGLDLATRAAIQKSSCAQDVISQSERNRTAQNVLVSETPTGAFKL